MRDLILRLDPGVDLRRAVEDACRRDLPGGAFVLGGIGSLLDPVLRLAGHEGGTRYDGAFELLTLSGSVTVDGAHLHASIASAAGEVAGGHLPYGNRVRTTAELLVVAVDSARLSRAFDAATGYAELVVTPGGRT